MGTRIAAPNLFVFAALGDNCGERHQNNSQTDNRQNEIKSCHIHTSYALDFNNHKLTDQKENEIITPKNAWEVSMRSRIDGSATEARAISAISEAISASFFNWFSVSWSNIYSYITSGKSEVKWL